MENDSADASKKDKAGERLDTMKAKLKSLQDNIDKEADVVRKMHLNDENSPEVKQIINIIKKVVALIPEITALEKQNGKLKSDEKDKQLDAMIEHLKEQEKFGKMWKNVEKARKEEIEAMKKQDDESKEAN